MDFGMERAQNLVIGWQKALKTGVNMGRGEQSNEE
jgi:hypothetical protein